MIHNANHFMPATAEMKKRVIQLAADHLTGAEIAVKMFHEFHLGEVPSVETVHDWRNRAIVEIIGSRKGS